MDRHEHSYPYTYTDLHTYIYSNAYTHIQKYKQAYPHSHSEDRLVGLVVKASASRAEDPGIFSGSSHTSDLKIGIPVVTLPGAW